MSKIITLPELLESRLPSIISSIAQENKINVFSENPDFLEERLVKWHQFGLLTHTINVRKAFLSELPNLIECWNLSQPYNSVMNQEVDKIPKKNLLEISIPLHDLGKIITYGDERVDRMHEIASKNLIYEPFLNSLLASLGLSAKHIDLIARCIETHDIIGKQLRDPLKHEGNLNLEYLKSEKEEVAKRSRNLANRYFDIKFEAGVYFLCDSLGKADLRIKADTSEDIKNQEQEIENQIKSRNLNSGLKYAAMQLPSNMKLAEIYLKNI